MICFASFPYTPPLTSVAVITSTNGTLIGASTNLFRYNSNLLNSAVNVALFTSTSNLPFTSVSLFANTLFVSAAYGNDATAVRNDPSHPWLSPSTAATNAQSGDLIYFTDGTFMYGLGTENVNYYFNDGTSLQSLTMKDGNLYGLGTFGSLTVASTKSYAYTYHSLKSISDGIGALANPGCVTVINAQDSINAAIVFGGKGLVLNCNSITNIQLTSVNSLYPIANDSFIEINANYYANSSSINVDDSPLYGGSVSAPFPVNWIINCKKMDFSRKNPSLSANITLVDNYNVTFKNCDIYCTNTANGGFILTSPLYLTSTTNNITMQNCRIRLGSNSFYNTTQSSGKAYWHFLNTVSDVAFTNQANATYFSTNVAGTLIVDTNWFSTP